LSDLGHARMSSLNWGSLLVDLGARVCALYRGVEIPSDIYGVLWIPLDHDGAWRFVASLMDERVLFEGHPTRKKRKGRLSPHTVRSYIRHVKRLFSWLVEEGRLDANPAERIKVQKPKRREVKAISREDLLAILATTEDGSVMGKRDRTFILLLADSGARAGGVCGLRVQDVDLESGTAEVVEKGGCFRFIYFTDATAQAIRDWLEVRPKDKGDWLFTGLRDYDKDAVSPNSLRQMLTRRAKRAGVTGPCSPHSFRHGFAVSYLMDGGDLASLADILGHTNIMVTREYYSVFTQEQLRRKHAKHSLVAQMFRNDNGEEEAETQEVAG
jgi:site-specific recombinase XerD